MMAIAIFVAEKLSKRSIAVAGLNYRSVRAYATGIANDLSGGTASATLLEITLRKDIASFCDRRGRTQQGKMRGVLIRTQLNVYAIGCAGSP